MVKIHLKKHEEDGLAFLRGTRIFALQLDEDILTIAKIAKGYDILANSSLTSVRVDNDNIKTFEAHDLLQSIIPDSFNRGDELEIVKVTKKVGDNFAWIATTSPDQLRKLHERKLPVLGELLQPSHAIGETLTEDEVAKRNCLILIAKNLNLIKNTEDTEEALCTHFGTKNINAVYFPRAKGTIYSRVANIECLSPVVFMQYVKKTEIFLGK